MKKKLIIMTFAMAFVLIFSSVASADFVKGFDKNLELYPDWIKDGQTQPIFTYADAITEIVWVEVPCDTDRDGLRDRVSAYIRRPNAPGFLCPVMLEHSSYHNGTVGWSRVSGAAFDGEYSYMREPFKYKDNWPIHKDPADLLYADTTDLTYDDIKYKGIEVYDWLWIDAPFETDSWYTGDKYGNVPAATVSAKDESGDTIYEPANAYSWSLSNFYRYYYPRGYALVYGQLLGNRDSDGITNTLHQEEVLSAMAIIKWLNGEAKAYSSRRGNVEVKADWANGNVSMTGTSYPADIAFATAVTGVKGLKAVMPQCNTCSWYDYYRYAGTVNSPGGYGGEDMNLHASFNFSRFNADVTSGVPPANGTWFPKSVQDVFFETQKHMMEKQDMYTGDYNTEWELRNAARLVENINEDVGMLMTTGFMDWNSQPKLSMMNWTVLLDKCPGTFKEFASVSSHASQAPAVIHGKSIVEWWHLWMDHFALGLDNGVVEALPDLTVINSKTGEAEGYWVNGNPNAQPGDPDYEPAFIERGGIVPGARNQTIYMVPGKDGKAGRLSYSVPENTVEHFRDLDILEQLDHTNLYPGAVALNTAYTSSGSQYNLQTTVPISSDGNRRITNYDNNGSNAANQQALFCEGRAVGVNRTHNFGITGTSPEDIQMINEQIFAAVDKPIEGRLMYLSEPLATDVRLSGTGVLRLMAAPDKGVGNLSAAVVAVGRIRNMENSRADAWGMSVGTGNNLLTAAPYTLPYGGGISGNISIGTFRNPSQVGAFVNYKYVTVGYADVQNPDYAGKAWFEVPEQNYIPNFYFQTTKIVPGKYYPYTIELDPYDYVFPAGSQIGVMVFGTDPDYSQLYDEDCTAQFDIKIAESYIKLPLLFDEPQEPVTIEVGSSIAVPGDAINIEYSVKDNEYGLSSLKLALPFDSSIFTPVGVTPADLFGEEDITFNIEGDVLYVNLAAKDNVAGNGVLFTVNYKVADNAPEGFKALLDVTVIEAQFGSFIDKVVDVETIVEPGMLNPGNCIVTFNYNGGEPALESMTVTFGKPYGELPVATRENYTFRGWSTDKTPYGMVTAESIVRIGGDHTLTALWAADLSKPLHIVYSGIGATSGTEPVDTMDYYSGDLAKVSNHGNLARKGYSFDGWNTKADGSGTAYAAGDFITIEDNVTLYAQWRAGLQLTTDAQQVKPGDTFSVKAFFDTPIQSNTAILDFVFATDKFAYQGFEAADNVTIVSEEETATGARITVMVLDYNTAEYGELKLAAKKEAIIKDEQNEITVTGNYVLRLADGKKVVKTEIASTVFDTIFVPDPKIWDGVTYDLIYLSNMIDVFGMDSTDAKWYSYKIFDLVADEKIDINDVALFANRIGK